MNRAIFAFFILITPFRTISQPLKFQLIDPKPLSILRQHPGSQLNDISNNLVLFRFYASKETKLTFINAKNEIFALPNGTGAVYKLNDYKFATFERVDSTLFHGYNNHAINFIFSDTIYSIGGYGLWHDNGQLRYYNINKAEWELKPIERLLPISEENFSDIRANSGNFYTYIKDQFTEGLIQNKEKIIDSIFRLSLTSGKVVNLGRPSEILKQIPNMPVKFYTNYGTLYLNSHEAILLDFENNQIKSWEELKIGDVFLSGLGKIKTTIYKDSIIYYFTKNKMDSIVIPFHKMRKMGQIYITDESNWLQAFSKITILYIIILLLIAWIVYLIYRNTPFKLINNLNKVGDKQNSAFMKLSKGESFSNIEIEIINVLLAYIHHEEKVNVENLNTILGVTKKSTEVQRKQRSQIIASINIKAKNLLQIEEDIIIRTKNEIDSRIVSYSIQEKFSDQLTKIINPLT